MSVMGLFFIFIASIVVIWLWRQGVMRSPWLEEGEVAHFPVQTSLSPPPPAKVGLGVFLAVAACLFSLMIAAYFMRQASPDWQTPSLPNVLWFNSLALVGASVSIQLAQVAAARRAIDSLKTWLGAGGLLSIVFLLGQIWAWRDLVDAGAYASGNPANAFFYLLTGAHALHLAGGLVALARTTGEAFEAHPSETLATSVELCAYYWHFLLFVWVLLLLMLTGRADAFGVICRRILS